MPWHSPSWLADYQWFLVDLGEAGWYWHLYWNDEKVNGGINDYKWEAEQEAENCAWKHNSLLRWLDTRRPYPSS